MSIRAVRRRRTSASYRVTRRNAVVVDPKTMSEEAIARFAAQDRLDEMVELSELTTYGLASRGRYHDHVFARGSR